MTTIHLHNHRQFPIAAGQSILDAAEAAGLALEHSCRTGRCGSCRTQVTSGRSTLLLAEEGLSDRERQQGLILSCARGAQTDLHLGLDDLGALAGIRRVTAPCRIHSLERLAPDVLEVRLRLPPTAAFRYLAGQHVAVIAPGGLRRSYSLATACSSTDAASAAVPLVQATHAAAQPALLKLHVRRVDQGAMSHHWFEQARPGDLLRLDGPLGTFHLRDCAGHSLVFLATGTGIAPIVAMLGELARRPASAQPRSVQLLWGGRQPADLYLQPQQAGLQFTPVLSRAGAGEPGAHGHVQDVLLQTPRDWSQAQVYACGSPAMVQGARHSLLAAGLPAKQFFADAFVASGDVPQAVAAHGALAIA